MTGRPRDGSRRSPGSRDERVLLARRLKHREDRIADGMTAFSGSMGFVYLHAAWCAGWLALDLGVLSPAAVFDPFPVGLLTLIVSLEAIFLSTFVLISQNRQAGRADVRSELDYETNVRSEIWSRAIAERIGVDAAEPSGGSGPSSTPTGRSCARPRPTDGGPGPGQCRGRRIWSALPGSGPRRAPSCVRLEMSSFG